MYRMGWSANHEAAKHQCARWRTLIVALALCGLTVSLATRFHVTFHAGAGVASHSAEPMRQHLNGDAMQWGAPIPVFTLFEVPARYPNAAPPAPLLTGVVFDHKLFNRPPPSC
jgi:hypothetical protein